VIGLTDKPLKSGKLVSGFASLCGGAAAASVIGFLKNSKLTPLRLER